MNIRLLNNNSFNTLLQNMPCGFFIYSGTIKCFMNFNQSFYEAFDYDTRTRSKSIALESLACQLVENDRSRFIKDITLMSEKKNREMNLCFRIKAGGGKMCRIVSRFYRFPDTGLGNLYYGFVTRSEPVDEYACSFQDKLYRDGLTGAFNRIYLNEILKVKKNISAIVIYDIDNFKKINDSFGHLAGDKILQDITNTVLKNIRIADTLVRFGGDEFLIVFSDFNTTSLKEKLHKIKNDIMQLNWEEYVGLRVSCSFGAVYTDNLSEESLKRADAQLYKAKITKNTVCVDS